MSAIIPEDALIFASEVSKAVTQILDRHLESDSDVKHYLPIGVVLLAEEEVFARFYEEGVEFYPEIKVVAK